MPSDLRVTHFEIVENIRKDIHSRMQAKVIRFKIATFTFILSVLIWIMFKVKVIL